MHPLDAARAAVSERVPEARAAFLGGSVLTKHRTAASDLDVVAVMEAPAQPYRESFHYGRWPVELFVHTEDSWHAFVDREVRKQRSPLLHMCGTGTLLFDIDGVGERLATEAKLRLESGPPAPSTSELDSRRYALTDLLDDLHGCRDEDERLCIVMELAQRVGELALLIHGSWLGGGKWLARRLHSNIPGLAQRLTAAVRAALAGEPGELRALVDDVLNQAGGHLWDGYSQSGT